MNSHYIWLKQTLMEFSVNIQNRSTGLTHRKSSKRPSWDPVHRLGHVLLMSMFTCM